MHVNNNTRGVTNNVNFFIPMLFWGKQTLFKNFNTLFGIDAVAKLHHLYAFYLRSSNKK